MFHKFLLGLISLGLVSCATVFSDSSDIINFTSVPEGAEVYINGHKIGETPISEKFVRDTFSKSNVQVKLAGHEEQHFILQKQLNKIALINLTFFPSWATDALTGNMVQYNPNSYHIFLRPKQTVATDFKKLQTTQNFILRNSQYLLNEIARGQGDHLKSVWQLHYQEMMDYSVFLNSIQDQSEQLLSSTKAPDLSVSLLELKRISP